MLADYAALEAENARLHERNDSLARDLALCAVERERFRAQLATIQGGMGEEVEVRGLQWLDTGHYRKKPPQFGYNPHDWNPLMTVAQHQRILAASVPAGCKVVPVELLERLEHVTRTLVPHLQCHVDLRGLLASAEGAENE